MDIIWQGAETPSNKEILIGAGVTRLGVSFKGLERRVHRPVGELLANFPEGVEVHAYPGMNNKKMSPEEHAALAERYEEFVEANCDRLSSWVEYDAPAMGRDWVRDRRDSFYGDFDEMCFRPVWHSDMGMSQLEELADRYPHVVVPHAAFASVPGLPALLSTLSRQHETDFHIFGMGDLDQISGHRSVFRDVYTPAWTAPMRNGETIIWAGNHLHRYPKKMKEQARAQHRADILAAGFNPDLVVQGNAKELSKLAVWSLQKYAEAAVVSSSRPSLTLLVSNDQRQEPESGAEQPSGVVAPQVSGGRHQPTSRHPSERRLLPTVQVETTTAVSQDENGVSVVEDVPVMRSTGTSMRACDTCFIAANCPEYRPNHSCAFEFSPQLRNREQLFAMLQTVLETQTGRVFFGKMTEDVNGGYPDPTVGKEIDRLMKLVETVRNVEDNREFVKLTMERRGSAGILSQIFGDRATQALAPPPVE